MVHEFFDLSKAADFQALSLKKDSTFEVRYFDLHGMGGPTRIILAISGAKFVNILPGDNWESDKAKTPFGLMPLLKETSADGKTFIQIAESDSIERYLARKFDLYGANALEETIINTYVSQANDVTSQIYSRYYPAKDDKEAQEKIRKQLVEGAISNWIKHHERHLQDNGANGHFISNKLTLADIKAAYLIPLLEHISAKEGLISPEKTPAILKVKETVDSIPSLKAWRESEEYQSFIQGNINWLGFPGSK
ncbi:hypothetical protein BX616_006658 [Lobosporangium transversale]|uniref:glutathione transferase n=1 Tax=Lobosporangium transversale TaxID=64571 RepID=A0A1Y2GRK0_9FUNG|nr:hypothetical protein BCR41DRAFT_385694 [Lobosporangium transversale]KAF9915208.1 hypothetical protein BX616_006658 [Lobosporangium transversale]ORZ20154.1 hypothetical protein BCR41DRAFT_385694 [Lobosporangium transversale]|eukprot:XP_021882694.1 hypothetical protein BCR41DRAFT_385694 [Lobosporangium transversale]